MALEYPMLYFLSGVWTDEQLTEWMTQQNERIRMTHKVIGVDVDGVLAMFNDSYARILSDVSGITFPKEDASWPNTWNWDRAAGVVKEHEKVAWGKIKEDPAFWQSLPPYKDTREFLLSLNASDHDVYFITNRMGTEVKSQTENWLEMHGYLDPTVLVSGEKGACAKALNITHYIDDKTENCLDVVFRSPFTATYMLGRPWNKDTNGIPRIGVLEFLDIIMEEEVSRV